MLIPENFVIDLRRNENVGLLLFEQIEQLLYARPIPNRHGPSRGGSRQKRSGTKMYPQLWYSPKARTLACPYQPSGEAGCIFPFSIHAARSSLVKSPDWKN